MIRNKKGISLISLIITIIVIIILATIVIFNGFGATESAQFAKFIQELSNYQEEMDQRFLDKKRQSLMQGETKTDAAIYAEIAGGEEKTVSSVLGDGTLLGNLNGTNCYEIQGIKNIYGGQTGVYITDKGEVFTMPGYRYSQDGVEKRYVNASKYYAGDVETSTGEPVEMTGTPTVIGEIAVKVGDYVEYVPDEATYAYNEAPLEKDEKDYYLGYDDEKSLNTDIDEKWRVVRINDGAGENGEILITPANAVNSLTLDGGPGYINSVRILDYVCGKLYSNRYLGTKARSMRQEDLDYKETGEITRYAYYVNGVEGMPATITVNGKEYTCKEHEPTVTYIFWEYDEGTDESCTREEEINGYTYRYAIPIENKPVLVTHKTTSPGPKYSGAMEKIGDSYGWLASPYADSYSAYGAYVIFEVRVANSSSMEYGGNIYCSYGYWRSGSLGLRPLVTLGSGLKLQANGEGTPGSRDNPWIITK